MPAPDAPSPPGPPGRAARTGVLALTVGVFAAVVFAVTLQLRAGLRDQVLRAQADVLVAVTTPKKIKLAMPIQGFIVLLRCRFFCCSNLVRPGQ